MASRTTTLSNFPTAVRVLGLVLSLICISEPGLWAGDLEWSGMYRAEGYAIHNSMLDTSLSNRKEYGVHTFVLNPKIIAADGVYINARLNIFNAANGDSSNQMGEYFGHGLGDATHSNVNNSNVASENQASEEMRVSQFYLTYRQEYGALVVGRAPLQFGLGVTHSAGNGLFDHYADTRDMVGYKMVMGNFYLFPIYAKIKEGVITGYDDVGEFDVHLQYENPESDVAMGVFYQNRSAGGGGNDIPVTAVGGATAGGGYNSKNFNIFYKKESPEYSVGFEVAQQGGDTGAYAADGKPVSMSGFAAALEYDWHPSAKKTSYGLKVGMATGDNPSTTDQYEGFIFDRNYDVAMLMFNFGFGQADVLHSSMLGWDTTTVDTKPDVEAITNATYFSPRFKHKWSDRWSMLGAFTMGSLDNTDMGVRTTNRDLGYELDLSFVFNVSEKVTWVNQMAYFEPGKAWEVEGLYKVSNVFGFVTKAAVSF